MANDKRMQKGNRVLNVATEQVDSYKERGYQVINEDGKVLEKATGGTEVSLADYNRLVEEVDTLRSQNQRTNDIDTDLVDALEKEKQELAARVTELEDEVKSYEDENERLTTELKAAKNKK